MSKLLIIDDERSLNRALKQVAELNKHSVQAAFCLKEGLVLMENFLPEIILLDVFLPDANALQCLPTLNLRGAKLVLMSAHEKLNKIQAKDLKGVDLFLPKPFCNIFESFKQIEDLITC